MSFSAMVKGQLCRIKNENNCCMVAELAGIFGTSGIPDKSGGVRILTENAALARRIFCGIRDVFNAYPEISIRKNSRLKKHVNYIVAVTPQTGRVMIHGRLGIEVESMRDGALRLTYGEKMEKTISENCCKRSFLRGAFLAGGSVSDPEKTYHLEIAVRHEDYARLVDSVINSYGLRSKVIQRKGNFVAYLKEGENIVDFLNIIGAHSALLKLENIRILKQMRNSVNRLVNCETANLDKTVNASVRQLSNIKFIQESIGLEKLPKSLQEIARLRMEHTEASLTELGAMLDPPLGKSGVNHRLRKLEKIAEEYKGNIKEIHSK
jgi:DNA-binding protein WhiA